MKVAAEIWHVVTVLGTVGGLLAYLVLVPRVSLHPSVILDPNDPFSTPFTLENQGSFSIYKVTTETILVAVRDARNNQISNSTISSNVNDSSELKPGRQTSLTINIKPAISGLGLPFQEAIVDVLVEKTLRAVRKFKPKSLLLAGGVAANSRLRQKFQLAINHWPSIINFFVPEPKLCTDNAAYIAGYAYFVNPSSRWENIEANPELTIVGQI